MKTAARIIATALVLLSAVGLRAASTADQLTALANDSAFRLRVQSLAVQQAGIIYSEAPQTISAISQATASVITTSGAHGLTTGRVVTIIVTGSNSTPSLDGTQSVLVVDSTHLKTSVTVTSAGTTGGFNTPARQQFAAFIMANPGGAAQNIAAVLVNRTNLVAGTTTYNFASGHVTTDVTDGAMLSQLATDWNLLSGV